MESGFLAITEDEVWGAALLTLLLRARAEILDCDVIALDGLWSAGLLSSYGFAKNLNRAMCGAPSRCLVSVLR